MRIRIISIALLLAAGVATPDSGTRAEEAKQATDPKLRRFLRGGGYG